MPATRTRLALTASTLALIFAACSSSSATPIPTQAVAAPTEAPTAAPTAEPTAEPTVAASESALPSLPASFQLPSSDKDLEAQLPNTYAGETLQKFSISGAEATAQDAETAALIASVGKSPADLSVAAAAGQTSGLSFVAVRLRGADQGTLQKLFELAAKQSTGKVEKISLAGHDVYKSTDAGGSTASYYYLKGDTAFGVVAPDDGTAAKALAVLP